MQLLVHAGIQVNMSVKGAPDVKQAASLVTVADSAVAVYNQRHLTYLLNLIKPPLK